MSETKQAPILMIPGPIEFHEDVLKVMGQPTPSHVAPTFIEEFGSALEGVRKVFLSKDAQPFIIAGSGTMGWDLIATNLCEPGDSALVVNTGYFSDSFFDCLECYGAKPVDIKHEIGAEADLKKVEEALQGDTKFKLVCLTQVDTSTGVLNNIKELAALVKKHQPDALIAVDGVCSFGAEEFRFDEWGIDACMTASQKALGVPPGLLVAALSQRALQVNKERKTRVNNYFLRLSNWLPIMQKYENRQPCYFATPPVNLIRALDCSLKKILALGMEEVFDIHLKTSTAFKAAVKSLGLTLTAANTLSAIRYPTADGMDKTQILKTMKSMGVICAGGLHKQCKAEYFRVGHMGISVTEPERGHLPRVVEALEKGMIAAGWKGETKALEVYKAAL